MKFKCTKTKSLEGFTEPSRLKKKKHQVIFYAAEALLLTNPMLSTTECPLASDGQLPDIYVLLFLSSTRTVLPLLVSLNCNSKIRLPESDFQKKLGSFFHLQESKAGLAFTKKQGQLSTTISQENLLIKAQ